ncbi:MAG: MoaD/ThiS family protein [Promethearchaeota archaeon]|nr:MAG: MoaD/ThiS family protein [Candidatus Lokiarchaeota archaeon]
MKVEILYFADFKDITGKDREFLELKENTVEGLTSKIFSKYNPLKNLIWDEKIKNLKGNISIVINDKLITDKNKGDVGLTDGDKVAFLLPFAGG